MTALSKEEDALLQPEAGGCRVRIGRYADIKSHQMNRSIDIVNIVYCFDTQDSIATLLQVRGTRDEGSIQVMGSCYI